MTCIKIPVTDQLKECLSFHHFQPEWKMVEVACGKSKQCVLMVDHIIIFCSDIPFDNVCQIKAENFHQDFVILLQSQSDGCCVISVHKKKMLDYWEYGKEIFIDDYVSIGHDQIIVVFDNDSEEDYYVTDYKCCFVDTRKEYHSENKEKIKDNKGDRHENSDGYKSAVKALSKRILSATAVLQDEKAKNEEKENLLHSTCQSLVYESSGHTNTHKVSENLVDLLNDDADIHKNECQNNVNRSVFKVLGVWKKVFYDQLAVGVEIQNISSQDMSNITLTLIRSDSCSTFTKVQFKSNRRDNKRGRKSLKLDNHNSRCFLKDEKQFLVAKTDIPHFKFLSEVEYNILIEYEIHEERKCSLCIENIVVAAHDIVTGSIEIPRDFNLRDDTSNFMFELCNLKHNFVLSSKVSSLRSLPLLLAKRLNCHSQILGNVSILQPKYLSAEVRITNAHSLCKCTVFTKCEEILMILLSEIEALLPADIEFGFDFDAINEAMRDFSSCLQQEISSCTIFMEWLMKEKKQEGDEKNIIVIDSPKKKRKAACNDKPEENEMMNAIVKSDECLINLLKNNLSIYIEFSFLFTTPIGLMFVS